MDKQVLKIVADSTGRVIAFATVGDIENGQLYTGEIPEGFLDDPYPSRYLLQNGLLILDKNYVEPSQPETAVDSSLAEQLVEMRKSLASASYQLMAEKQKSSVLAKQQAQLSFEIMQLQGGKNNA